MGRRRASNPLNLPPRVYAKGGRLYYFHPGGRWEPLGTDVDVARRRAQEIRDAQGDAFGTTAYWLDEFLTACRARVAADELAPRTLEDYTRDVVPLKAFFGAMYPAGIESPHVAEYLDAGAEMKRGVRANRERACLSAAFTWLIRKGLAGVKANPCRGVRRNRETKRARYVEDAEMRATLADAPVQVRALAELIYRTLQRPEDIITWTQRNLVERRGPDGAPVRIIRNAQSKVATAVVDIAITPEIDAVLASLRMTAGNVQGMTLIHRQDGLPYTYTGLCSMLRRRQVAVRLQHAGTGHALERMPSWGFYDLKGKGATDMWQAGTPIALIQALCGHESAKTTEVYVKSRWRGIVQPNRVERAV